MSFLSATIGAISRHGLELLYNSVTTGAYNVETGSTTNVKIPYFLKFYPKHIQANSYNFPTLVGKEAVMFYLAQDALAFTPKMNDEITYQGFVYRVQSYQQHVANGTVVLYRIIAVRG